MNKFFKVENEPGLIKDSHNGAVLNVDKTALNRHRRYKRSLNQKNGEIESLKSRLAAIEEFLGIKNGNDNITQC